MEKKIRLTEEQLYNLVKEAAEKIAEENMVDEDENAIEDA